MPSGFSKNLGLELMLTGENAGTWGEVTNVNLVAIDDAINGIADITVGPGGVTVTTADAPALSDGRSKVLNFTGNVGDPVAGVPVTVDVTIAPSDAEKTYFVRNGTNGHLRFSQGSGAKYTVNAGYSAVIHCDGTGLAASVFGTLSSFQCDKLLVKGPAELTGAISITGGVTIQGDVALKSKLDVDGNTTFGPGTVVVTGPAPDQPAFGVNGVTTLVGAVQISGATQINSALGVVGTLTAAGAVNFTHTTAATTIAGPVVVNNTLTVAGNVSVTAGGTLLVSGVAALQGGCAVTGTLDVSGSVISRSLLYVEAGMRFKSAEGGDALFDMYFRNGNEQLGRMPVGSPGQHLRVHPGGGPAWMAADPPPAVTVPPGTPMPGGVEYGVLYCGAGSVFQGGFYYISPQNFVYIDGFAESSMFGLKGTAEAHRLRFYSATDLPAWDLAQRSTGYGNKSLCFLRYNDAGAVLGCSFEMLRNGHILMGGITGDVGGSVNIESLSAADVALVIRGKGGQTGHLTVWQNSAGTSLSWIDANGIFGGAAGNVNWVTMNRTTSYSLGSNVNVGALFFYNTTVSGATPGGYLSFQYGLGVTGGSLYMPLPVTGGTGITTGLTWLYRNGNNAPLAQTFEEYRHDSALGIVDNILAHADVLDRLREAVRGQ